jgi:hypothetical protein
VGQVVYLPVDPVVRWQLRFPDELEYDPNPQASVPCSRCAATFAWRRYAGLCGWCYDGRPAA